MKSCDILVIDTGSSSMRGLLYHQDGALLFKKQRTYFMDVTDTDTAQQDSACYRDSLFDICKSAAAECAERCISPCALALTSQRSSVLALDGEGQPLHPILMWYDKRSAAICNSFPESVLERSYQLSGQRLTPVLSAPKMSWFKQTDPGLYERTYKLAGIHDYLLWLCTGRFVTDESLACRTGLLDVAHGVWSEELLTLFGIDRAKLCSVLPPGSIVGVTSARFAQTTGLPAGIPVVTAGGDQQCSLLGQGVLSPGDLGITSGTASYVCGLSRSPVCDAGRRFNTGAAALPGRYIVEASNMASGSVYDWFLRTFYGDGADITDINREVLLSPAGARGLLMLPDLSGKGCPQWDSAARGSFLHIGLHHTRADFARAVLEGICAEIAECCQTLAAHCAPGGAVLSCGGLARLPAFQQMIADMTVRTVTACPEEETTALGAWVNAALAIGLYSRAEEALGALQQAKNPEHKPLTVFTPDSHQVSFYQKQAEARRYVRACLSSTVLAGLLR